MKLPLIEMCKVFEKRRICMLMVTHACNLNCTYCYEAFKSQRHMDTALAKAIIEEELALVRQSDQYDELEVDFMGGEPLMNFLVIREVVDWLLEFKQDVPFITFCSTNGTLISESNKDWLKERRNALVLSLSYDGDFHMQKQNRGTSRRAIDMKFFMDTWPTEPFHMTISKETLPRLAKGAIELQQAGGRLTAALAQGVDWTDEDASLYREQLDMLKEAYLADERLKPLNLLTRPLFGIARPDPIQAKYCGAGTSMIAYDIDGKKYPCHMFSPVVLGADCSLDLEKSGVTEGCDVTDHSCDGCNLNSWCPTCYGFNYRFRGSVSSRDHRWCAMIIAQALASCEFQLAYYHKHMDQLADQDMAQLKMALEAHRSFADILGTTGGLTCSSSAQVGL